MNFSLEYKIRWRIGVSGVDFPRAHWLHDLAISHFPGRVLQPPRGWSPQEFYNCVHCPEKDLEIVQSIQPDSLRTELYPFQKRAVTWLLHREKVRLGADARLVTIKDPPTSLPLSFTKHYDVDGNARYFSHLLEEIRVSLHDTSDTLRGGILAEEMGLGKTVELIALMLLHQRSGSPQNPSVDLVGEDGSVLAPSGATLIVTPPSILEQWKSELAGHAPSLKVHHYQGVKKSNPTLSSKELRNSLLQYDVVLTTYTVLAQEIHYAGKPQDRELRHRKVYKPRRSPLVKISWWRVCLDEAQLIESGVSNAAAVAQVIPRCNAWAVSGTPLRKDVNDLLGLLIFLKYQPFCRPDVWNRLINGYASLDSKTRHGFQDVFAGIFSNIAMRHVKSRLRDELVLPPQKRVTITMSFTATEEQNYSDLFKQACNDIGVDLAGGPLTGNWDPDNSAVVEQMRSWLRRLRQTCLHAEIGGSNRRAFGSRARPLRTVDEVLGVMIMQNETGLRSQERTVLTHTVMRGHLLSFGGQPQQALDTYLGALQVASDAVTECRAQFEEEQRRVAEMKEATEAVAETDDEEDEEEEDGKKGRLAIFRQRLRSALEMQHICYFFAGTAYYQVKENTDLTAPESPEYRQLEENEAKCYDAAKIVRKELLQEVTKRTTKLMDQVAKAKSATLNPWSPIESFHNFRGLESRKMTQLIEDLVRMMNEYSKHLNECRSKLIDSLLKQLLDQEDDLELTGDEYETSTKLQDEQYVLLEAMRAGIADRYCILTGQTNLLINQEMKSALKLATQGSRDEPDMKGPAPELFASILAARQRMNPPENISVPPNNRTVPDTPISFRGIMADLRSMITAAQWQQSTRGVAEAHILEAELKNLQNVTSAKLKEMERQEKEIDLFRSTMNQRLDFYRQLQQISDTVVPLQEEASEQVDVGRLRAEERKEAKASEKLSSLRTKQRFLVHLQQEAGNTEPRTCVICTDTFEIGVLTVCGHQYCKDCLGLWYARHRSCPICKRDLRANDFHQITYKPRELRAQEEAASSTPEEGSSASASPSKGSIYSNVTDSTLKQIKGIDLPSEHSYGVKVDTMSRHLLWIRQHDPGSKSIIFSQYRDFLSVLGSALTAHKIGHARMGEKQGIQRFQEDPAVECFLLDAKADSSGLNLVNATHVFLAEPLINTAIELQAIARVHRIGQRRPTTVWMYLISDTVEEAIYEISVARRLAHMQQSTTSRAASRAQTPDAGRVSEQALDSANSMELQSAPMSQLLNKGQDGEMVPKDDLWSCLFGKPRARGDVLAGAAADGALGALLRGEAAEQRRSIGE